MLAVTDTSISLATPETDSIAEKSQENLIDPAEATYLSPTNYQGQEDWPDLYYKFTLEAMVRGANEKEGLQKEKGGGQDEGSNEQLSLYIALPSSPI